MQYSDIDIPPPHKDFSSTPLPGTLSFEDPIKTLQVNATGLRQVVHWRYFQEFSVIFWGYQFTDVLFRDLPAGGENRRGGASISLDKTWNLRPTIYAAHLTATGLAA